MSPNRFIDELNTHKNNASTSGSAGLLDRISIDNSTLAIRRKLQAEWPDTLTHYCSADVAESILGGGRIWLTDVRKMNDSSELTYAIDYLHKKTELILMAGEFPELLLEIVRSDLDYWTGNQEIKKGTEVFRNKFVMAMCLSSQRDDANMWRLYGDGGRGVAIYFNKERLSRAINTAGIFIPNSTTSEAGLAEVCYPNKHCNCLEQLLHEVFEAYEQSQKQSERDFIRTLFHGEILRLLMGHKHQSFSGEHEYRIFVHTPVDKTWIGSDEVFEFVDGHRNFHYSIVFLPHQAINISEEEFWNELIDGVSLGPLAKENVKDTVEAALTLRGLGNKLSESLVPLRK